VRRRLRLLGFAGAAGLYVWFAAVLNVGEVKARKAARRRTRAT